VILLDITLRIRAEGVLRPFLYLIESEGRPSLRAKVRIVFFFSFFCSFFFYFSVFFYSFPSPRSPPSASIRPIRHDNSAIRRSLCNDFWNFLTTLRMSRVLSISETSVNRVSDASVVITRDACTEICAKFVSQVLSQEKYRRGCIRVSKLKNS